MRGNLLAYLNIFTLPAWVAIALTFLACLFLSEICVRSPKSPKLDCGRREIFDASRTLSEPTGSPAGRVATLALCAFSSAVYAHYASDLTARMTALAPPTLFRSIREALEMDYQGRTVSLNIFVIRSENYYVVRVHVEVHCSTGLPFRDRLHYPFLLKESRVSKSFNISVRVFQYTL